MRFFVKQLDTTNRNKTGAEKVEKDLNDSVNKIEKDENFIVGEDFMPQQNAVRSILLLKYKKGKPKGTKYSFLILDSRNSYDVVGKMLNAEVLALEKKGREIVRGLLVPMKNDGFTQLLLAHESKIGYTDDKQSVLKKEEEK